METKIQLTYILLMIPVILTDHTKDIDYCSVASCPNKSHTLCQYSDSHLGQACKATLPFQLGQHEVDTILFMHNNVELLSTAHELRMHSGTSGFNRPFLEWDEELALIAKRWVDQCTTAHDQCRNVVRFNVTQRIGTNEAYAYQSPPTIEPIIKNWYTQSSLHNLETLNCRNLCLENSLCTNTRHEKGMVWGKATRIGCGAIRKIKKLLITLVLVCNYGPK